MNKETMIASIDMVAKQRNIFIGVALLSIACLLCVSLKLLFTGERIVLVPGLSKEAWVENEGVSNAYLEESAVMYLPMLLDLDINSIEWKRDRVMSYVSHTDPRYLKELHEYFARVKEHYVNFSLSTHFALKKIESDPRNLTVIVHGLLIKHFGNRGSETDAAIYKLSYEWTGGKLLLKEFVKITKEDLKS